VGLEIKRELVAGELRERRAAMLPAICALGGMVVPAGLYLLLTVGTPGEAGWGIPMATDIAFAMGVLALVGKRAPAGLKVLLLSLAIVDDLGAILVIAVFYSEGLALGWLAAAGAIVAVIVVLRRLDVRSLVPYVVLAGGLWLAVFSSGVHATLAGVVLGFLTPARPFYRLEAAAHAAEPHLRDGVASTMLDVRNLAREAVSPLERLETQLHPWSAFLVLPLFALANAGVVLSGDTLGDVFSQPVTVGVIVGLVVGKPLGIVAAALIAVRVGIAVLPEGVTWRHLAGVGALAGIGFTVAIFIAGLAFREPELISAAKVGILLASVVAGLLGAALLWRGAGAGQDLSAGPSPPRRPS